MLTYKSYFLNEMDRLSFEELVVNNLNDIDTEEVLKMDDREILKILQRLN
ncbi:hypothetical protein KGR20_23550 [Cytobacillus oceanisediminis]|nr:hypothetical protein [Cytobacillus oceanisediminis]MBZ9537127.1 hypothetical protein [Cytobacillus oceanisediminis]